MKIKTYGNESFKEELFLNKSTNRNIETFNTSVDRSLSMIEANKTFKTIKSKNKSKGKSKNKSKNKSKSKTKNKSNKPVIYLQISELFIIRFF